MTNETMTKNGKYWNDQKMGNIEMIQKWEILKWSKNEKNWSNRFFWLCGYLLFLGDQINFDCQINGEDQPCHWLDDCKLVW